MEHSTIFTDIYQREYWGSNEAADYRGSSGSGSSVHYNQDTYVPWLRGFLQENHITSVVDIGCGDFRCGPLIYDGLDIAYHGFDVYAPLVNSLSKRYSKYTFTTADCFKERHTLPTADLCILKDVLQHWSTAEIYTFLDDVIGAKKFRYILVCNCAQQKKDNKDIKTGKQRQLSAAFLPLKQYRARVLFRYSTKEVSVIEPVNEGFGHGSIGGMPE